MRTKGRWARVAMAFALVVWGCSSGGSATQDGGGDDGASSPDTASGGDGSYPDVVAPDNAVPGDTGGSMDAQTGDTKTGDTGPGLDVAVGDSGFDAGDAGIVDASVQEGGADGPPMACPPGKYLCECNSGKDYCLKIGFTCLAPTAC